MTEKDHDTSAMNGQTVGCTRVRLSAHHAPRPVEVDATRASHCHLASAFETPTAEHTAQGLLVPDAELRDECAADTSAYTVTMVYFRQLSQRP